MTTAVPLAALRAADSGSSTGGVGSLLIFVPIVLVMIWLLSRQSRRRSQQAEALAREIAPGTEVMTGSGLFGTVRSVEGDVVSLEIAPGVVVRSAAGAIVRIISPDDLPQTPAQFAPVHDDPSTDPSA